MTTTPATTALARRLGLSDALMIGLGSMIGAGIFASFAPAAQAAGSGLLIGLAIAALVAFCNATSSAQLAAQYPTSGGSYVYGRERLGEWAGFVAGWCFVIGKTASAAAMALTVAAYAVPPGWQRPVAIAVVLALTAVNLVGVTRTALVTKVLVVMSLLVLALVVVIGLGTDATPSTPSVRPDAHGVLQAAGFLFFAFAGYARIATMGEEVREPARTIPRAIVGALACALVVYLVVALAALNTLGATGLAAAHAPLEQVVRAAGQAWAAPVVRVGACAAAAGALLAMVAGLGRTSLAMARNRDLPPVLSAVHPRFGVPHRADLVVGLAVCVLVATTDLRGAIGFSSFGVLLYYLVANLSALSQDAGHRRWPRALPVIGASGCVVLVAALPLEPVLWGLVVLVVGLAYRAVRLGLERRAG